jgi:hypothetical protein
VTDVRVDVPSRDSQEAPRGTGPPARLLLAVILLVGAIIINIAQFRGIDEGTIRNFKALQRNPAADILDLGYRQCPYCRDRYGLHLALQVAAPGSTVFVSDAGPYGASRYLTEEFTLRLYALGRVERVEWVDFQLDPRLLSPDDLDEHVVASGPGGERGAPWLLAVDAPLSGLPVGDPDRFLRQALQDGEHRGNERPAREFVVLEWPTPREGSDDAHQDLVLETSLLPASVRGELIEEPAR